MLFGDDSASAVCGIVNCDVFEYASSALAVSGSRRTNMKARRGG